MYYTQNVVNASSVSERQVTQQGANLYNQKSFNKNLSSYKQNRNTLCKEEAKRFIPILQPERLNLKVRNKGLHF